MGWFSSVVHAVTHPGQLVSDGEHWLGQVADQGAHAVGSGLSAVGLGQAGQWVDHLGDDAANSLDPELELGQTDDPTQLIHGDPGVIRQTASSLHTFSGAFGQTAAGLNGIDTSHWTGSAAEAFRARYSPQPGKWQEASTASSSAGGALGSYADTVEWAQGQAREAIAVYADGQRATAAASSAYDDQVAAYNLDQDPGPRPAEPAPFSDPGASLRERAQQILLDARAGRDRAGAAAADTVTKGTDLAPAEPGFWSQAGDDLSDLNQGSQLAGASLDAGVLTGVADIGKFVRVVNPLDTWNLEHPAEYLAGISAVGAGLVQDAVHPQDLVGQVLGGGWGSDPFEALGKLVPQAALALVTDGGGAAADAGAAAGDVGEDAARLGGTAGEDAAAGVARSPADMTTAADPVDVATGDVIVSQADVRLPGMLPLMLGRVHRSSHRGGRWFGRSWASTLDQRLVVAGELVVFAAEGGVVLCYPRPSDDDVPVLPVAGARRPLTRHRYGYTVTDPQAGVAWRFAPRRGFYLSAGGDGELPLVSVSDRGGHQISIEYGPDGEPRSCTHDGGYRVRVVISGGRVAGLVLAGGGPDGQDVPVARYGYDQAGDLAEVVDSSGTPQRFRYDEAGRLTGWTDRNGWSYQYRYDEEGRCVRGEGPGGTLSGTFSYDHDGTVTTYTDAAGAVTRYQVTSKFQVAAVTDALGNVTRFTRDRHGRLVSRADPLGRVTRWSYDGAGNLAAVTRPDGSRAVAVYGELNLPLAVTEPDGSIWSQDYDTAGNLIRLAGPDGSVTRFSYDGRGHLAGVTDPEGSSTMVECDRAGLPVVITGPDGARSSYHRDGFGRVAAVTGPDRSVTRLEWSAEGRLASRTFADGRSERYAYDGEGNLVAHANPAGAVTRFEYGPFDQVSARVWPDGTRTSYGYDQALRLITVCHSGLTWRYHRDLAGRLVAETDYNGAVTRYTSDAAGQLTRRVSPAGQQISLGYDLLGNVTERRAGGAVTRLGYDLAGRLVRASSPAATLALERDVMGRVIAETCNGRTVRSGYDGAGRRVLRVTPSGAQARWHYDTAGRPSLLETAGQELRFGYDPAGRETLRELPGRLRLAQEWDTTGQLVTQTLGSSGRMLQHRGYSYRADGCLAGLDDLLSGPRRLTLDAGGRVTAMVGPDWAEQYGYDPLGNITAAAWPAPPGPAGDWTGADVQGARQYSGTLITGAGAVRYQHDAQGRVTMRQRVRLSRKPDTWHYEWDAESRLTAVTTPDGSRWQYLYDPLGRRIAKQRLDRYGRLAAQTDFTWDGPVLAEETASGGPAGSRTLTWDYRPGSFTPLTQAEHASWRHAPQEQVDRTFYAIVTDLIGAPSELVSPDGALAGYQQHTLWGTTLWHPGGASSPLRFPGQYADPETGLHYNHQRYYDPATGRYLSPDPLGLAPAPNPHAYVLNPQVTADPLGLMGCGNPISFLDRSDPVNEGIFQNYLRAEREPGYQDVMIHGAENARAFEIGGRAVSPSQLATALRASPAYAAGPIRLLACRAGYEWGGIAQQLSDELGVPVRAPTDDLWIHRDGRMTIGPTGKDDTGIWFNFYPGAPNRPNLAYMVIPGAG